jgi:formyl-CoA transferase/CoA:oxalate CoA-transferase
MTEKADVLIENFRPGALDRLGLGYQNVRSRNRRIIYCSISGYGQDGPMRNEPAMDLILQASSGLMSITGTEDGRYVRCGLSVADITAGIFALVGILMALRARDHSGVGQFVDVSMFDSIISTMTSNFVNYTGSGIVPRHLARVLPVSFRIARSRPRTVTLRLLWAATNCGTAFAGRSVMPSSSGIRTMQQMCCG